MKKTFFIVCTILLCALCIITGGCKKQEDISLQQQQQSISISSIAPSSGPYGTIDTIKGNGFSAIANGNVVKFNGKEAVIQNYSSTQLTVVVPKGAGTGTVTVTSAGKNVVGLTFTYKATATVSTLADINPTSGFASFSGITNDAEGNVYTSIYGNANAGVYVIDKINAAGEVTTLQLSHFPGDDPTGLTADSAGNLYVTDQNSTISKISSTGLVTTLAGTQYVFGLKDGADLSAQFASPAGLACDNQGNIYVADLNNNCIRKIDVQQMVSTVAGNGIAGFADANGADARFSHPAGIVCDTKGNIYVADFGNNCIRQISPGGNVTTLAGDGKAGFVDGKNHGAEFNGPYSLTIDADNNIYVADEYNNSIRKITPDGTVTTFAGDGTAGFLDSTGALARFNNPNGITCDRQGNIYVADSGNKRIRKTSFE